MRELKNEWQHYLETKVDGAYETTDISWRSDLQGDSHRAFEDTEITTTKDNIIAERKMLVDGKVFTVCSIFPQAPKTTPTDKMLKIIENDLEK